MVSHKKTSGRPKTSSKSSSDGDGRTPKDEDGDRTESLVVSSERSVEDVLRNADRLLTEEEVSRLFFLTDRALRHQRVSGRKPGSLARKVGSRLRYEPSDLLVYWTEVLEEARRRHGLDGAD